MLLPPLPLHLTRRPPGLDSCTVVVPECASPPSQLALQRCSCPACQAAAGGTCTGFWGSLRSLQVQTAGAALQVDSGLLRLLRRCASVCLAVGCTPHGPGAPDAALLEAGGAADDPDLHPWLAALAPVFESTALQSFNLQAACAVLLPSLQPAGGWVLQAGDAAPAWEGPRLAATSLPSSGSWHERSAGLAAQLKGGCGTFQLYVWRCEE